MLVPTADGPPRAIVMDFGLAQAAATDAPMKPDGTDDSPPLIAGTLGYMAPEQLAGGAVTAAVDVYAFGVVLHEMLTGVLPPFRPTIARRDKTAPLPPPASLLDRLDIPSRWNVLIRRCLERDPAARFRDILEARDAVANGREPSRRMAVAAAATAAALAAAVGVGLWKRSSAGTVTPPAVAVPALPPASPPVARPWDDPKPVTPAARPVPEPGKAGVAVRSKPPHPPASTRRQAKPDDAPRPPPETVARGTPGSDRSIADTDEAIDPFREPR
jgi:serine/threonine-protein kinase